MATANCFGVIPNGFEGIFVDGKPYNGMLFTVDGKISEYKDGEQL